MGELADLLDEVERRLGITGPSVAAEAKASDLPARTPGVVNPVASALLLNPVLDPRADATRSSPSGFVLEVPTASELLRSENITLTYITNAVDAQQALDALPESGTPIGFDIETAKLNEFAEHPYAGLDPNLSRIRLVQIYAGSNTVYVFDIDAVGLAALSPLWVRPLVAHNAVFELKHLLHAGVFPDDLDCTMLQANALGGPLTSLADLAQRHLNWTLFKELQVSDWNSPVLTPDQLAYAALDSVAVQRIAAEQSTDLARRKRIRTYQLMKSAQRAIAEMELKGIHFEREGHATLASRWDTLLKHSEEELRVHVGSELNPASSVQFADWLSRNLESKVLHRWPKTPTGQLKTDTDTLRRASTHPTIAPLVAFKDAKTRASTYGRGYAKHLNPVTGRLHPHFNLGGTATGRLSCRDPNVQNVPRDREFRALFSAPSGRVLVVADYSQMELRVAALVSRDPAMLEAYARGEDLHRKTAGAIAGVAPGLVTPEQRQMAKAVNFGLLYGMGAEGLARYAATSYGVSMSAKQAQQSKEKFFATYPGLAIWQRQAAASAQRRQRVITPAGRVRDFSREPGGYRYTEALNTPIQAGAAEVLLAVLGRLPALLADLDAGLVNVIHDELVLEVVERDALETKARVEGAMVAGMLDIFPAATISGLVDAKIVPNWGCGK